MSGDVSSSGAIARGELKSGVLAGLILAAIAGAVTWLVLRAALPVFHLPEEFANLPLSLPGELVEKVDAAKFATLGYNTMFAVGVFGALVAGLLAVGEGIARRSVAAALAGGLLCAVAGGAAGCLAGFAGHLIWRDNMIHGEGTPLAIALRIHAVTLLILGGGAGAAIGAFAARSLRAAAACLLAGALAGVSAGALYPFLSAVLTAYVHLPANTDLVVPPGELNRALWIGLAATLLGLFIPGLKLGRSQRTKPITSSGAAQ